jgi:shikimate dehydrogenase
MSPIMHNAAFEDLNLKNMYIAVDILPKQLKQAVKSLKTFNFKGANVTIPHKETIIKFLDEIDPLAQKIGAVNTIKNNEGFLIGKNTDASGAKKSLIDSGCKLKDTKVIMLGAGGAARAIAYVLADDVSEILIFNRNEKRAIELSNNLRMDKDVNVFGKILDENNLKKELSDANIIINTTPIGMYPNINKSPLTKDLLYNNLFVFDIIYNPIETKLIKEAKEKGCMTLGGLNMLVNQGALAFEWWTNQKPNKELMKNKILELLRL